MKNKLPLLALALFGALTSSLAASSPLHFLHANYVSHGYVTSIKNYQADLFISTLAALPLVVGVTRLQEIPFLEGSLLVLGTLATLFVFNAIQQNYTEEQEKLNSPALKHLAVFKEGLQKIKLLREAVPDSEVAQIAWAKGILNEVTALRETFQQLIALQEAIPVSAAVNTKEFQKALKNLTALQEAQKALQEAAIIPAVTAQNALEKIKAFQKDLKHTIVSIEVDLELKELGDALKQSAAADKELKEKALISAITDTAVLQKALQDVIALKEALQNIASLQDVIALKDIRKMLQDVTPVTTSSNQNALANLSKLEQKLKEALVRQNLLKWLS